MSKEDYKKYKASDIFFQMNLGSLKGYYGKHVKRKAKWLKRKGFYDYSGSDLHGRSMVSHIFDPKYPPPKKKKFTVEYAKPPDKNQQIFIRVP